MSEENPFARKSEAFIRGNMSQHTQIGEQLFEQTAKRLVTQVEKVLSDALTRYLGRGWTYKSLQGRVAHGVMPDNSEVYIIDEMPLVRFEPIEITVKREGLRHFLQVDRKYQVLI